ncbi:MAG: glycosyltransferase [Kiritimatiellae bacterium]|nr:glycosyltransferase [Kiritimatiellia bacterium]MDD5522663.1 glycosyltransferase [Kiritimatiellia bacterium]
MKNLTIHQLVSGFALGDAISSEALSIKDICTRMGITSFIYAPATRISPDMVHVARRMEDFAAGPDDIVIYHHSILSEATDTYITSSGRKVLLYHNITPAGFFNPFDSEVATQLRTARDDLKRIAAAADARWAVSRYDALELDALGFKDVRVFPLIFNIPQYTVAPDPSILGKFSADLTNILCVGRLAPNKCIEELILAFAWYNKSIDPFSRLIIVGSKQTVPAYYAMLRMLAGELDLANVCFEDFASPVGVAAYYRVADVFVSVSRHEGYCLPLIEAMHSSVPVIARAIGGMPEAMDGAGVLFDDMNPCELAELIHDVVSNPMIRNEVMVSQAKRMERLASRSVDNEFKELLSPLFGKQ